MVALAIALSTCGLICRALSLQKLLPIQIPMEVQNAIARIQSELEIIPPIDGLPEGLSKQAFTEQYQRVDSEAYLKEVEEIKRQNSLTAALSKISGKA